MCGQDIDEAQVEQEVEARLKEVELTKFGNQIAGTYSGGMRRRLSVAVGVFIGLSVGLLT